MSTPDQFVVQKLNMRTQEIEKLFANVQYPEPYGKVELVVGLGQLKTPPQPQSEPEVETRIIYFTRVSSYGIVPHDRVPEAAPENFTTPELAFAAWSENMDRFLFENTGRETLFWRHRPELGHQKQFDNNETYWQVYSRLGVC